MSNFEILKQEIIECRIRAKSNETIQVLSYLQEFAENNQDSHRFFRDQDQKGHKWVPVLQAAPGLL